MTQFLSNARGFATWAAVVTMYAHAKINLALRVYEKKPNGYHRIETVMAKLALADEVDMEIRPKPGISISVPGFPALENDGNLAVRAARLFLETVGRSEGVSIRIKKIIPIGGGLGGGSSDAAAVLLTLHQEFGGINQARLLRLGAQLGADVPFLIDPSPIAFAGGIGDELTPWPPLPPRSVVLVYPGFESSTAEAYQALSRTLTWSHPNGSSFAPLRRPEIWSDLKWLLDVGNDLQAPVEARFPVVAEIRTKLKEFGAAFAQMSGSGSTVFGIFDDVSDAKRATESMRKMKFRVEETRTIGA